MSFLAWFLEYKWIILFYLAIVLIIFIFKKKFVFQSKFIALYKTKIGLKLMDKIGVKHSEFIKILGYVGIGIGYLGMLIIMCFIVKGVYDIMFVPNALPVLSPVIPGVQIPGSPILVPFWYGIISLFIVVVVHEFSHGVVARAHGLKVLNSGILFFGPLIGAFVEPDEKTLNKSSDVVKYSVFAAGPFSNIILAALVLLFTMFVMTPIVDHYAQPVGFEFSLIEPGMPAEKAGLKTGVIYNKINNATILDIASLQLAFSNLSVNQTITIGNDQGTYEVMTTERPSVPGKAVIGVSLKERYTNDESLWMKILFWLNGSSGQLGLISWIFMLSLGLGLANLLPVGPVDGGRMILESLQKTYGLDKGKKIWLKVTMIMLFVIIVLVFVPIVKAVWPMIIGLF